MRPSSALLSLVLGIVAPAFGAAPPAADATSETVTISLRAGTRLDSALATLNASGLRIVYSSALVLPTMTLRTTPKAAPIDALLAEILTPWHLRAIHASNGDWLVVAATESQTGAFTEPIAAGEPDIESIDVTASRRRLATAGASERFLDRQDVQRMPHLADDAVRMLKVLPGVSGGDFSAALNIRGGRREEAALMVDGAEIHNGFHFRDIDGALSVLDTNLVQGIDFITGGMTAEYGDYMSGVVSLQSRRPAADEPYRHGVGISFVSAYGRSSGTFAGDRGTWLVSLRRGFLDVITERVVEDDEQLTPRYTDVFASTDFDWGERTSLGARVLVSDDDLKFINGDNSDDIDSAGNGHSTHLWLTLDHAWSDALAMRTLVSAATVNQQRAANGRDERRSGSVRSDNDFRFLDLRQDWSWTWSKRHLPRIGFNFSRQQASYNYMLVAQIVDPLVTQIPIDIARATDMKAHLDKLGAFASWRTRLTDAITAEAGARWDHYRYDHGLEFDVLSPRLNVVYSWTGNELRAAWGVVHQPQGVHELQVEDHVTQFFAPERVSHAIVGYTRHFAHGLSLRVDLYRKAYEDLRPRFENALDPVQLIPEGSSDRVRIDAPAARARGVELTLRREASRGLSGWVSASVAKAEEQELGEWRPRSWDQRTTLSFGSSWTGAKWNISLAGLFHSGTPSTSVGVEITPLPGGGFEAEGRVGSRNGARMGKYARVDMRANRDVLLANSKLSLYVEITNLLNAKNECCVDDYGIEPDRNGRPIFFQETGYWLPMLPSFGFQWEF